MEHFSLIHEVFDRSSDVLDRNLRINAMLIEEIDTIRLQPLQRKLNDLLDVFGFAVQAWKSLSCLLIDVPAIF
jgi:hypothetical protein